MTNKLLMEELFSLRYTLQECKTNLLNSFQDATIMEPGVGMKMVDIAYDLTLIINKLDKLLDAKD